MNVEVQIHNEVEWSYLCVQTWAREIAEFELYEYLK